MENLSTKAILLDMTTDLSRVAMFSLQEKDKRVGQFAAKLEQAIVVLKNRTIPVNIIFFVHKIDNLLADLKQKRKKAKELLAEDAFTYGNILSRRANKLLS